MPEPIAQFRSEGQPAFQSENTETDNSAASQAGEETETEIHQSDEGAKNSDVKKEKELPFHEHPRWKEREEQWNKRYNEQESRYQTDIQKLREEFSQKRQDNADNDDIPKWFGGDKEQWDEYRKHEDTRLQQAEERAYKRLKSENESQDKLVKEATDYMQTEVSAIQEDKTLNPSGEKIDKDIQNKLLKFVLDNDLVDSKGRWNWKAGWRLMQANSTTKAPNTKEKKTFAGATTSESKAEEKTRTYTTSSDFKNPQNRPW